MLNKHHQIIIFFATICGLNLCNLPIQSQEIFGSPTLKPNFSPDEKILTGVSGGKSEASAITGIKNTQTGPCNGYVNKEGGHKLILTETFKYLSLMVEVAKNEPEPEDDLTLIVTSKWGTWCNDEYTGRGKNPGIAGKWIQGEYQIWVGSYKENKTLPYKITITEK
ncbi:MAG TPA: hypothetical protein V6C58_06390 [Allocoleopsis sp.]